MEDRLTEDERSILLQLARQAMVEAIHRKTREPVHLDALPEGLRQMGATFVTLTIQGELRGCIGALEAYLPLAEDVREHAAAAALQDYRFPPVQPEELDQIRIEISRLTVPQDLSYDNPQDLLTKLRPHMDGVTLWDGLRRATFLPQVWEKIPDGEMFLSLLCQKMGASPDLWRYRKLKVQIYQVEEFHESEDLTVE